MGRRRAIRMRRMDACGTPSPRALAAARTSGVIRASRTRRVSTLGKVARTAETLTIGHCSLATSRMRYTMIRVHVIQSHRRTTLFALTMSTSPYHNSLVSGKLPLRILGSQIRKIMEEPAAINFMSHLDVPTLRPLPLESCDVIVQVSVPLRGRSLEKICWIAS